MELTRQTEGSSDLVWVFNPEDSDWYVLASTMVGVFSSEGVITRKFRIGTKMGQGNKLVPDIPDWATDFQYAFNTVRNTCTLDIWD